MLLDTVKNANWCKLYSWDVNYPTLEDKTFVYTKMNDLTGLVNGLIELKQSDSYMFKYQTMPDHNNQQWTVYVFDEKSEYGNQTEILDIIKAQ